MKEENEPAPSPPRLADHGDEGRIVPFVDDDETGVFEHQRQVVQRWGGREGAGLEVRVELVKRGKPSLAVVGDKVGEAPGAFRLVGDDVMAQSAQLPQHAPQEMRVAVIPAGAERMGEIDDPHARSPSSWEAAALP